VLIGSAAGCEDWIPASSGHAASVSTVQDGSGAFVPAIVHIDTSSADGT